MIGNHFDYQLIMQEELFFDFNPLVGQNNKIWRYFSLLSHISWTKQAIDGENNKQIKQE